MQEECKFYNSDKKILQFEIHLVREYFYIFAILRQRLVIILQILEHKIS